MSEFTPRPQDCSICGRIGERIVWVGTFMCIKCAKFLESLKQK